MNEQQQKFSVLVVDDHESPREGFRKLFEVEGCKVVTAAGKDEVLKVVAHGEHLDVALIDAMLGDNESGHSIAAELEVSSPRTAVVMMSMQPETQLAYGGRFNRRAVVVKTAFTYMYEILLGEIKRHNMSDSARATRLTALYPVLSDKDLVHLTMVTVGNKGEPMCKGHYIDVDKSQVKMAWNTYFSPTEGSKICVPIGDGCGKGLCAFCLAAETPLKHAFPARVMTGMALHALDTSYLFADLFDRPRTVELNFGGLGEPFQNIEEVFKAMKRLREVRIGETSLFKLVAPTIGGVEEFQQFLDVYAPEIPGTEIHWSLHGDEESRPMIMPGTSGQSLYAQRDLLRLIQEVLGTQVVVYWGLAPEWNMGIEHAKWLSEFLSGCGFVVKVSVIQPPEESRLFPSMATDEDADRFVGQLIAFGQPAYANPNPSSLIRRTTTLPGVRTGI